MLAITAHIDESVKADIEECGFSGVLDAPLKVLTIKELIFPML